jgi:uncharacterized 2Fe-2S/4Fe-4S cluster protein (DUF4445 family)
MPTVTFLPGYRKVEVPRKSTILEAAQHANLHMNVVCGGQGKCGKCVVYVRSGRVSFDVKKFSKLFTPEELERGACLACQTQVLNNIRVEIPASSLVQEQKILIETMDIETEFVPSVRKYSLSLQPPSLDDPTPDITRILDQISKEGGPEARHIYAPLDVLRSVPQILRQGNWKVTATVAIVPGGYRLINVEEGDTTNRLYGVAVDLGTTTIVVYLRNLITGEIMGTASNYNKQIGFGEDILSRVNYAKKPGGLERLQKMAVDGINEALTTVANSAGIDRDDIYEVVVAGNTVMTHLLLGIDPGYMIAEPYVPVVRRALSTAAGRIGVAISSNAGVYTFPAVSNFIGGDIIADILTSGISEQEEISLQLDIGTNFEVVLGCSEWMLSCAGAAGPALEGGEVLSGMRANPGAIERVMIDPETLDPTYTTINNIKPRGICGSGLIDLLAELLRACVIDRTGHINMWIQHPRIRSGRYFPEYVVAFAGETDGDRDIVITENDIKNLVMSKAAIHAACTTLMNAAGITRDEITGIYFSGAFGNYLSKENAITIGLIPEVPLPRIHNIGNGAITGANIALINRKKRKILDEIAQKITYIELNAEPSFMDQYTSSCFLPHTDLSLFPEVQKMLDECRIRRGS